MGWFLFFQITDFDQFGYTRQNTFILGTLVFKWDWVCGRAELQHREVSQPCLNWCGFSALSWGFPPAQYSDFRSWKEAAAVVGLAGVEGCWAAWAASTWHYYTSPSLAPLLGLYLDNPIKMRGLEGILRLFMTIYCYFPAAMDIHYMYLASCITCSSLTKLACSESAFLFTSAFQIIFFLSVVGSVCVCSWYLLLQMFLLSPYLCICIYGCFYFKCPSWKSTFLDSVSKAFAPCLSCACMDKQNRCTW